MSLGTVVGRAVVLAIVASVALAPVTVVGASLADAAHSDRSSGTWTERPSQSDDATGATPATLQPQTEDEPNDDPGNADVIQSGSVIEGTVSSVDDVDAFAIDVSEEQTTIRVNLTRPASSGTLGVAVYGPDGFLAGRFVPSSSTAQFVANASQAGRYYVVVASGSQFTDEPGTEGTGPYTLEVTTKSLGDDGQNPFFPPPEPTTPTPGPTTETPTPAPTTETPGPTTSETEPNDDPSSANTLRLDSPVAGTVDSTDDFDWYSLDLSAGDNVTVELARGDGSGSFLVGAISPAGEVLTAGFANTSETVTLTVQAEQSGTYLIGVGSYEANPGTGTYLLSARPARVTGGVGDGFDSDPNEPNDNLQTATRLSPGTPLSGAIATTGDVDVFAAPGVEGGRVNFTFTNTGSTGSLEVSMVGPDGEPVVFGDGTTTFDIPPGAEWWFDVGSQATGNTFFVVRAGNGTGPYTLSVRSTDASGLPIDGSDGGGGGFPQSEEREPNDDPANATDVTDNTSTAGSISSTSDLDWFAVDVDRDDLLTAALTTTSTAGSLGFAILDPNRRQLRERLELGGGESGQLQDVVAQTGTHYVAVTSAGGTGSYTLHVRSFGPDEDEGDEEGSG